MAIINYLVEGEIDDAVANRIIDATGHISGVSYGRRGFGYIQSKLPGFSNAARDQSLLVLADFMDTGYQCPPEAVLNLLPIPNPRVLLRLVVREIESWLLADRENISEFLGVAITRIPEQPEAIEDPKQFLVNLARHSQRGTIRRTLVPAEHSTAQIGTLYTSELRRFVREDWNINAARLLSPSLHKSLVRLDQIP